MGAEETMRILQTLPPSGADNWELQQHGSLSLTTQCQLKCDELEAQNEELVSEYDAVEKDKKESTEYLKYSLVAKRKKVSEQSDKLEDQQKTAKRDEEALKLEHQQQMEKLQQLRDELESTRNIQASKLEEQQKQLEEVETLQKQLLMEKEEEEEAAIHQQEEEEAAIHQQQQEEEEEALETEGMPSDMEILVETMVKEQEESSLQKEKERHSCRLKQLPFLQRETQPLRNQRDALRDKEVELNLELKEVKENTLKMNALKPNLNKYLKQLKHEYHQLVAEMKDADVVQQHILDKTEGLRRRLNSASEQFDQRSSKFDQLEAELQRERSRKSELEGVKQEADVILGLILTDSGKAIDTRLTLQRLLEILESSAPSWKTGFSLRDSPRGRKPRSSRPVKKLDSLRTCSSIDPTPQNTDLESEASTSADR